MGLIQTIEPTVDPVSLDEAKTHLRVTADADDGYITGLVLAARALVEADTRRALITQSWRLALDDYWPEAQEAPTRYRRVEGYSAGYSGGYGLGTGFASRRWRYRIVLPRPPLQAVTAITYMDTNGLLQTLDPSQYVVAKAATGEWYIEPAYNIVWPQVRTQLDAIFVDFVCGYGDGPGSIPEMLRIAILLLVAQWYDQRSPLHMFSRSSAAVQELPNAVQALVQRFRVMY